MCELREPTPEAASIFIDRGFALYGVGGNNALKLRTTHDIDLLTDIDLDRRDKVYRIHHRETGQGVNHMPWVLSAQGFGLFLDSSFPMTLDLRDGFGVEGQNIRTYYFINGPTPAAAVSRFVKLTGLPPMHPAWALGYEQSSRTWMNPGELDFVTTYFREKRIPCDGFVLLSTYGGDGGVGRSARGFHAGYPDLYQGWNPLRQLYRVQPEAAAGRRGGHPKAEGARLPSHRPRLLGQRLLGPRGLRERLAGAQVPVRGRLGGLVARRHRVRQRGPQGRDHPALSAGLPPPGHE